MTPPLPAVVAEPSYRGGSGEPLVLIHGFTATWRSWQPVLPALEAHHDVLAVGLAGHFGCPSLPAGTEVSVPALTNAVARDMDAAGIGTAHLVGNSLGGWIALELAKRGRARSVVAIAPAGGWHHHDERCARALARRMRLAYRLSLAVASHVERLAARPRSRHLLMRSLVARPERLPAADVAYILRAASACSITRPMLRAVSGHGPAGDLGLIDRPVLLAWPELDRVLPARRFAGRFITEIPGAEYVELPGTGHAPMSDDPDLVARTILDFTRRHR